MSKNYRVRIAPHTGQCARQNSWDPSNPSRSISGRPVVILAQDLLLSNKFWTFLAGSGSLPPDAAFEEALFGSRFRNGRLRNPARGWPRPVDG